MGPYTRPISMITRPYTRPNDLKTILSPAAHTHIANIWEYPSPQGLSNSESDNYWLRKDAIMFVAILFILLNIKLTNVSGFVCETLYSILKCVIVWFCVLRHWEANCTAVNTAIVSQIKKWHTADNCKQGGEKCLYIVCWVSLWLASCRNCGCATYRVTLPTLCVTPKA